jgi:VCBS repeat-containing protein
MTTISSSTTTTLPSNVNDLILTGTGDINGTGNSLANTITGNAGNNILNGGSGADTLIGGAGNDTYVVDNTNDVVVENAGEGTDTVQAAVSYTLSANVENLTLSGSSSINGTGNDIDNVITGNAGNNSLSGMDGNDTLVANAGNDTLDGGTGADDMQGGTGNDTYVVDNAGDLVTEALNGGTDTVQSSIDYTLTANVENLSLTGSGDLNGTGNELDNTIVGNSGSNHLVGGDGNDTLNGGAGADTLEGGTGNDTYVVDNAGDLVIEASGAGTDLVQSSITYTLTDNVENLTLTGSANIDGTGNELDNTITGNSGANTLVGGAGNDVLDGGSGADQLAGGTGDDTYVVDNVADVVIENAGEGTDLVQASVNYTLADNVENLTLAGGGSINGTGNVLDNVITGNNGNNVLSGMDGNDTLVGNAGNDTLDGGTGADNMQGGTGNDTYVVDNVGDLVIETLNAGTDTVQSSIDYTLTANVENLTLTGTDNLNGTGNELNNIITGNSGDNVLNGGLGDDSLSGAGGNDHLLGDAGNDLLDGGAGADTMEGGAGNDTYVVDDAGDLVIEASGAGTDLVQSSITYTLTDNVENLTLTGTADINGTGNELDNVINGNTGNNVLDGLAGNDTINGNAGDDTLFGGAGNDTLNGGDGNDTMHGDAGNDVLNGGLGADSMQGGTGDDTYVVDDAGDIVVENAGEGTDLVQASISYTLTDNVENLTLTGAAAINGTGNGLDNVITGNNGANVLSGMDGNDTLVGNAGNDTLDGGAGADNMQGGTGNDTYVVDNAGDVVTEALNGGTDTVQSSIDYTLTANVENLTLTGTDNLNGTGNELNNIITGNSGDNTLSGGLGDDSLSGGAGNDHILGDAGNDLLDGGAGADTMEGGAGNDTYVVDDAGDLVIEGSNAGTDLVQSSITYALTDNVENLTLTGTADINGTGNDLDNIINGNTGNNVLDGHAGNDTINAGAGNDTLFGGDGNDTLHGDAGNDHLDGGAGNDMLDGGTGADVMQGGTGDDTYIVDDAGDSVIENAGEGTDLVQAGISYTLTDNVENLTLTGAGATNGTGNALDNVITGNNGANVLSGLDGNDTLIGNGGNDTLDGGAGADNMQGGIGNDTYVVDNVGDVVTEAANAGTDTVQSSIDYTLTANVENLTLTGTADLHGTGNALANTIIGNSGANVIDGGAGVDTMSGGAGDDTYIVDNSADVVVETAGGGNDTVYASATYTLSANVENLVLTGTSSINGTGNAGDNTITGNDGNNVLSGGGGADVMQGGAGNDTYVVDDAHDTVIENAGAGTDTVMAGVSYTLSANVEVLTLTGSANIDGTGNELDNLITGNGGNNVLSGGDGNDSLIGGAGNDTLIGGAGADTLQGGLGDDSYRFHAGDGADRIIDSQGSDTLYMQGIGHAAVHAEQQGTDLLLTVAGTSDSVLLVNWVGQGEGVSHLVFDDGTVLDRPAIMALLNAPAAPAETPPTAVADNITVGEDNGVMQVAASQLLANDTDPDAGAVLSVVSVGTSAAGATVTLDNGVVKYDLGGHFQELAQGQVLNDSFTYTITDETGKTASAVVNVSIVGANDAPVAVHDAAAVTDHAVTTASGNLLANDSDVDAGTVLKVAAPGTYAGSYGTLTVAQDGSYSYALDAGNAKLAALGQGESAVDSFAYSATDGIASVQSKLDITINGANDAPVASADAAQAAEDAQIAVHGNVLANDTDADTGTALQVAAPGTYAGHYGTLTLAQDGSYTYSLDNAASGVQSLAQGQTVVDSFSYAATDGTANAASKLDITISGTNDAPVVTADAGQVAEDGQVSASGNLLANDSDVDAGAGLTVAAPGTYAGTYGTLTVAQDGSYIYNLDNNGVGVQALAQGQAVVDSFSYAATDGIANTASKLDITITGSNDAPVVAADAAQVAEDGQVSASGNLLANDSDVDAGTVLTVAAPGTYAGSYGTLTVAQDGSYTYSLDNAAAGVQSLAQGQTVVDTFSYAATDGTASVASKLDITIAGANDAPVVTADAAQAAEDGQVSVSGNLLANDRDVDAGTVLKVAAPGTYTGSYGTLTVAQDGSYTYSLDNAAAGVQSLAQGQTVVDSFSYAATDGTANVESKLDITVTGANDAPVAKADAVSISEDLASAKGNVLANDSDVDAGTVLSVAAATLAGSYGSLTLSQDGSYVYQLDAAKAQSLGRGATVTDHFTYTATDGIASSASSLDVTVVGADDAPTVARALADTYVNFNKSFSFKLPAGSFADADKGDVLTYSATLADGSKLPSWLKFDAATGTFSGVAPKQVASFDVRVTATDKVGATGSTVGSLSVSDVFKLTVDHGNEGVGNGEDGAPPGHNGDNFNDGPGTSPGHPGAKGSFSIDLQVAGLLLTATLGAGADNKPSLSVDVQEHPVSDDAPIVLIGITHGHDHISIPLF